MKKIRWTAVAALVSALALGLCSGLLERTSLSKGDATFVLYCAEMAGKLFTLAALFIVVYGLQWQRAKALSRLEKVEGELTRMQTKLVHLKAYTL